MRTYRYTEAIKLTIYASFGLSIVLLLTLVYINLNNISFTKEKLHQMINVNNVIIARLHNLEYASKERTMTLLRLIDETDEFVLDEGLMRHRALASKYVEDRDLLLPLLDKQDEKNLFVYLGQLIGEIQPLHNHLIQALENKDRRLIQKYKDEIYEKQIQLYDFFSDFIGHIEDHNQEFASALNRSAEKTYSYGVVIGVIVIFGFLIMAFLVSRYIFSRTDALEKFSLDVVSAQLTSNQENKAKSLFIANVSHEIRTPLTAIQGAIALLDKELEKDRSQSLSNLIHIANRNCQRLIVLLNDILDFSKIESGKIEFKYSKFQLLPELKEIADLFKPQIFEKGLEFRLDYAIEEDQTVVTDKNRLRQILINLLSNAIKFTERGNVALTVTIRSQQNEKDLYIQVKDTGIGITNEQQQLIFNSFTQADPSSTKEYGGTGLGLSICKHLVEGMGGTIHVDSELGVGSIFRVSIPLGELKTDS